jgi:hypothetical protein
MPITPCTYKGINIAEVNMPEYEMKPMMFEIVIILFLNKGSGSTGVFTFVSVKIKSTKPTAAPAKSLIIIGEFQEYLVPAQEKARSSDTMVRVRNNEPGKSIDSDSLLATLGKRNRIIKKATKPRGRNIQNTQCHSKWSTT